MKKRFHIFPCLVICMSIILIVFNYNSRDSQENKISGEIIESASDGFVFQNKSGEQYAVDATSTSEYSVGDYVTVYYRGEILEISPARFKHVIKIELEYAGEMSR